MLFVVLGKALLFVFVTVRGYVILGILTATKAKGHINGYKRDRIGLLTVAAKGRSLAVCWATVQVAFTFYSRNVVNSVKGGLPGVHKREDIAYGNKGLIVVAPIISSRTFAVRTVRRIVQGEVGLSDIGGSSFYASFRM